MAMPMSAPLMAGGVVHAVAGHRDDRVAGFQCENISGDDGRDGNHRDLTVTPHLGLGGAVIFLSAAMDFSALNS